MKRIDVVKKDGKWIAEAGGQMLTRGRTKSDAVRNTAKLAKSDPQPVSVRIHGENGQIQQERTYPRTVDQRGSKG